MKVFVQTDVGRVRPINEDSFYAPREGERFCAIADGMGGHNAGEVASAMAVEAFAQVMRGCGEPSPAATRQAVETANEFVYKRAQGAPGLSGMGTTFTALARSARGVLVAHVGDSRAYLIRSGAILRLTMDHTLVEEMVLQGLITQREARYHPKRNYITRALGTAESVRVDLTQVELRRGDVFFLCTDGLSNHVEDAQILEITQSDADWGEKLRRLVARALDEGGSDNITAMYAIFEEASR